MTTKVVLPPNWDYMKEQLGFQQDAWLRKRGWESTSSTPGSYWMWQKELEVQNGYGRTDPKVKKTFVVDRETAVCIEEHLQSMEYYDAHPDEMDD